jgi:uncharacterized membrane protein
MKRPILERRNYQIIIVGIILIATGFILMSGGRSDDPEVFNPEIYNFRRIRLAPTLILIGLALQAYGILYNKKK